MPSLTLARTLQYKKRVVGELARVTSLIMSNNSLEKSERESSDIKVKDLLERRNLLVNQIIDLKTKMYTANQGEQQRRIFLLAELKGTLSLYSTLNTRHGEQRNPYNYGNESPATITYDAVISRAEAEAIVLQLNKDIDHLQEEIEKYNYNTKIEVDDIGLI